MIQEAHSVVVPQRTISRKSNRHLYTHAHTSVNSQQSKGRADKISIKGRADKQNVYMQTMDYYSALKRNVTLTYVTI